VDAKLAFMAGRVMVPPPPRPLGRRASAGPAWILSLSLAASVVRVATATEPGAARVEAPGSSGAGAERSFSRPYGAVEFGVGVLALPDAQLCGGAGCDRGDISLEVDAWPIFRASPRFAVGAGITLALTPTQDVPRRDTTFARDHSRRYFMVEGIGRYYFAHGRALEVWSGVSTGLVVVSDNFRTVSSEPAFTIIGANSANIATEGLSLGLAAGATFGVSDQLQVGGTLRFANWFLPSQQEAIAFEEEASLANRVTMINLALTVAYHGR
jgi:hypothetical protein